MKADKGHPVKDGLHRFCHRKFSAQPENIHRLTGGANMEIWSFDCAGNGFILRRYPDGNVISFETESLTLNDEAEIIRLVQAHGVKAPQIDGILEPEDGLDIGFVMERMPGEAKPHILFKNAQFAPALEKFVEEAAQELARIHAIDLADINVILPRQTAKESVNALRETLNKFDAELPIYHYALRWLEQNTPPETTPVLLHGDFRMGNLLLEKTGIAAVIDWELAHIGDPAEDLAWLCTPSWRFGRYDNPVAGIGQIEDLLSAYERAGGRSIEPERLRFWLVYSILRWGMMTLAMTEMWRQGLDKSLERALIGTRASEVEVDLLLLLEEHAQTDQPLAYEYEIFSCDLPKGEIQMSELAGATTDWIKSELIPKETGRAQFNARIGAKTLSIIGRLAEFGPGFAKQREQRLSDIGFGNKELCEALYAGSVDLTTKGVLDHLRLSTIERLSIYQPRYAGLAIAREKWQVREDHYV